ncbi:MFS transporter [Tellurirhabdus rosea]|uniref:MFS transporter n=1 Tax=Tellurirhabdus rosea TaxID=2674997 RepID=UPI00224FAF9C|nr:MFS transporter [Tellurirhabdus rosea]
MIGPFLRTYRNAFRGLSPSVWLLAGVMLINRSGTMVLPYLTLYLTQHLHFSVTDAGIVMAVYGAGAFCGTFLGGRLTDRLGFYPVQFLSLLTAGFFLIGLQFLHDFYVICATVFVYTLVGDAFRPANSAAVAHYSTAENRTRAYSMNRLAINLGWSVGGGLGGLLAGIDYSLLFWVDGLTCVAAAAVLRLYLPKPAAPVLSRDPLAEDVPPIRSPYRDGLYLAFAFFTMLNAVVFMQLFSLVPLYFKQVLLLKETQIGLLMTMNGLLIVAVEMAFVYAVERRYPAGKVRLISGGVAAIGLSYLLLLTGNWPGVAVVMVLLNTFGEMMSMPFMQAFSVERSDERSRGQYLAVYSMAYAIAQIAAPALGSQIVERAGFLTLWVAAAGICALSAAGFWWLSGQVRTGVSREVSVS